MKKTWCGLWLALMLAGPVWAADSTNVTSVVLVKTTMSWDGKALPAYPQGQPEITMVRVTIPPGAQLPLHQHPVINAGLLTQGELTVVTADNKVLHLKAGDPIVEVVNTWHYGKNEGRLPAEIVVFYAGTPDVAITVKK